MRVLTEEEYMSENSAVALGMFDAIHKGHISIINSLLDFAKKNNLVSVVFLFSNVPEGVVSETYVKTVYPLKKRIEILEELGVDTVYVKSFDFDFMNISCESFANEYILKKLSAKAVFAGFNYTFGKGRSGNVDLLKNICKSKEIVCNIIPEFKVGGESVSSTRIRELLKNGVPQKARELLGRCFSVSGVVKKGLNIGSTKLGFPTANVEYPKDICELKDGVYITKTRIFGKLYNSVTNVGKKPTVGVYEKNIETHIIEEFSDLYGEEIEIFFYEYLREIQQFDDCEGLKKQIEIDKNKANIYFNL